MAKWQKQSEMIDTLVTKRPAVWTIKQGRAVVGEVCTWNGEDFHIEYTTAKGNRRSHIAGIYSFRSLDTAKSEVERMLKRHGRI